MPHIAPSPSTSVPLIAGPDTRPATIVPRLPAVRALAIQCFAFLLCLPLIPLFLFLSRSPATKDAIAGISPFWLMLCAALLLGSMAALISRLFRLASWWLPIQFLFAPAAVLTDALAVPPTLFLAGFLLLLGVYWSTFRTQVPYFPSGPAAWEAVESLLPPDQPVRLIDVGSGIGGLLLHLAQQRPADMYAGIELAPLPWLLSRVRGWFSDSGVHFARGDYAKLDFSAYDVVFAYLSPAAMPALWDKAQREMRPGTMLLSYEFQVAGRTPDMVRETTAAGRSLYGWII